MSTYESNPDLKILPINEKDKNFDKNKKSSWFNNDQYYKQLNISSLKPHIKPVYPSDILEILTDKKPILALKAAIELNSKWFFNKVILVIESGLGLYSLLAAKNKAKKVYSLESNKSAFLYQKDIIYENNLGKTIIPLNKTIFEVDEYEINEDIDIIICDWFGDFCVKDSLLPEVIYARDNFLKRNGFIFPDKAYVYMAMLENSQYKEEKINIWDNVYGINMRCIQKNCIKDPMIQRINKDEIISEKCWINYIDVYEITEREINFSNEYRVIIDKENRKWNGVVTWFDISFEQGLGNNVLFSTSSTADKTRFKQVSFYFENDINVNKGDVVYGSFCARTSANKASEVCDIKISYHVGNGNLSKKEIKNKGVQLYKIT